MPSADPRTPEWSEDSREAIARSVDSERSSVDLTRENVYESLTKATGKAGSFTTARGDAEPAQMSCRRGLSRSRRTDVEPGGEPSRVSSNERKLESTIR